MPNRRRISLKSTDISAISGNMRLPQKAHVFWTIEGRARNCSDRKTKATEGSIVENFWVRAFRPNGAVSALAALIISIAIMALPCAARADADRRVALVIGNGAYKAAPALDNPPVDAKAVAAKLKGLGFEVVEGYDLNMAQMRDAVANFSAALPDAKAAVVYYAGHGVSVDEENYLLPTDIVLKNPTDLDLGAISVSLLLRQMKREERSNILILDACRDNPFAAELARSKSRSVVAERGFSRIADKLASGTLISFATDPGATAQDGPAGEHSPFTKALLDHLEDPGVTVGTMMERVGSEVSTLTNKKQTPWVSSSLTGEFMLKPAAAPEKVEVSRRSVDVAPQYAPEPGSRAEENLLWQSAQQSNLAADYQAYLDAYPSGVFAKMARNRVASLGAAAAPPAITVARIDPRAISVEPTTPALKAEPPPPVKSESPPAIQSETAAPFKAEVGTIDLERSLNLNTADRKELQQRLTTIGFDAGSPNGEFGDRTRLAIADWQRKNKVAPTGWLGPLQLAAIKAASEAPYQSLLDAQSKMRVPPPPVVAAPFRPPVQAARKPPQLRPVVQRQQHNPTTSGRSDVTTASPPVENPSPQSWYDSHTMHF